MSEFLLYYLEVKIFLKAIGEITHLKGSSVFLTIIPQSKLLTTALPPDLPWPHMAFFFLSFSLPARSYHKAVWQSSLFSFRRMNEDKKQSKMEQERHRSLWFMIWPGSLALPCSLPARLAACLPVWSSPSPLMEIRSLLTVTPSSHQEWLIMVLNIDPCLTCVKIPPTL